MKALYPPMDTLYVSITVSKIKLIIKNDSSNLVGSSNKIIMIQKYTSPGNHRKDYMKIHD